MENVVESLNGIDETFLQRMSEASRRLARKYSWEAVGA